MQNRKRHDCYRGDSDPPLNSPAYMACVRLDWAGNLLLLFSCQHQIQGSGDHWRFGWGHRDLGHRAKQAVFLLPWTIRQPTGALALILLGQFKQQYSRTKFPLNFRMAVGLYCHRFSAAIFPEAAIISASAIQWVMEEVRTKYASKPLGCYLPMTHICEAPTLLLHCSRHNKKHELSVV